MPELCISWWKYFFSNETMVTSYYSEAHTRFFSENLLLACAKIYNQAKDKRGEQIHYGQIKSDRVLNLSQSPYGVLVKKKAKATSFKWTFRCWRWIHQFPELLYFYLKIRIKVHTTAVAKEDVAIPRIRTRSFEGFIIAVVSVQMVDWISPSRIWSFVYVFTILMYVREFPVGAFSRSPLTLMEWAHL